MSVAETTVATGAVPARRMSSRFLRSELSC